MDHFIVFEGFVTQNDRLDDDLLLEYGLPLVIVFSWLHVNDWCIDPFSPDQQGEAVNSNVLHVYSLMASLEFDPAVSPVMVLVVVSDWR